MPPTPSRHCCAHPPAPPPAAGAAMAPAVGASCAQHGLRCTGQSAQAAARIQETVSHPPSRSTSSCRRLNSSGVSWGSISSSSSLLSTLCSRGFAAWCTLLACRVAHEGWVGVVAGHESQEARPVVWPMKGGWAWSQGTNHKRHGLPARAPLRMLPAVQGKVGAGVEGRRAGGAP